MKWSEQLKSEIETSYATTENLLDKVDSYSLERKLASGSNWMTVGHVVGQFKLSKWAKSD